MVFRLPGFGCDMFLALAFAAAFCIFSWRSFSPEIGVQPVDAPWLMVVNVLSTLFCVRSLSYCSCTALRFLEFFFDIEARSVVKNDVEVQDAVTSFAPLFVRV